MERTELQEFNEWLMRNSRMFSTYTIAEMADVAVACGFDRSMVAQWQTSQSFKLKTA